MKIMLICTTGGVVNNFRLDLIEALIASGHTVTVVADYSEVKPVKDNFEVVDISVDNKSNNVFSTLNYYYKVKKAVQSVGPDVVITFMIKPNTFGARAALKVKGVKVFSMIEGMGTVYTVNTVKYMLIRKITDFLYKSNMRKLDGLFCLNDYDADYFRGKFIPDNKLHVIPGIGLDTEKYAFSEITNHNVVAMFARLLKEKGVEDYCNAAALVKKNMPEVKFLLYGQKEKETDDIVKEYGKRGIIEYKGITSDIPKTLNEVGIVVLPSYREGSSRIIMEAMSCGRPVITYDTIGCNHLINSGNDGILVPLRNVNSLAEAIAKVCKNNQYADELGKNARMRAVNEYDSSKINEKIISILTRK